MDSLEPRPDQFDNMTPEELKMSIRAHLDEMITKHSIQVASGVKACSADIPEYLCRDQAFYREYVTNLFEEKGYVLASQHFKPGAFIPYNCVKRYVDTYKPFTYEFVQKYSEKEYQSSYITYKAVAPIDYAACDPSTIVKFNYLYVCYKPKST